MTSPWLDFSLGAFSLYPLSGSVFNLEGFFPPRLHHLYSVFSTIFSFIIYLYIQWAFEKLEGLPLFIPIWFTAILGLISLLIYIWINQTYRRRYRELLPKKKAIYIIVTLLLFSLFVSSLTYSFNVLENYKDYYIIKGNITAVDSEITKKVSIQLSLEGIQKETHFSKKNGNFFMIISKNKYKKINTIRFILRQKDNQLLSTKGINDLPLNQKWRIELKQ